MEQEITCFKPEDFNIDCISACSKSENDYFCYRRIGQSKDIQNLGCKECGKYKKKDIKLV